MLAPSGEAHFQKTRLGHLECVGAAGEFQRQGDVLKGRHGRHKMERLENDADVAAAHEGEGIFVESGEILANDLHLAASGALKARHDHQQ